MKLPRLERLVASLSTAGDVISLAPCDPPKAACFVAAEVSSRSTCGLEAEPPIPEIEFAIER